MANYTLKDYADVRIYQGILAYSPDGTQIAHVTNESGQFNLWVIPSGGGERRQLTHFTDNTVRGVDWSPDGKTIVFSADANGDEQIQLYLLDVASGGITPLRHMEKRQHALNGYSPDGRWIGYTANTGEPGDMDLQLVDPATGEHRTLSTGKLMYGGPFSPDGRLLAAASIHSNTSQELHIFDIERGEIIAEYVPETEAIVGPVDWSPDGKTLFFVSNFGREFTGLAAFDLPTKSWTYVQTPDWGFEQAVLLDKRNQLIWSLNEDGTSTLYGIDLTTQEPLNLPVLPYGVLTGLIANPQGTRLALTFSQATEAANLYEINLESGTLAALGQSMIGGIPEDEFVAPELVRFPTFDGRMIPAWLFKPKHGQAPYPTVLSIHGGPESQERPGYAYYGFYQYMLNKGFAILAPNIRGSTGYGISYQKLVHRDFGGDDLKDIEAAAKFLQGLDFVDNNRIAVFGGSYGGFATLSAVTRLPQYWAAAVDLVGPSNLVTFAKAVPPFWKRMMKAWVGDPDEDFDFLMSRSPITYVDNIKAPLLVIQGANDPRVVKAESDQMVERIRANGGKVIYYVDENEGHGTTRKEATVKWYTMIGDFLADELLDEPALEQ
jgi:dipeptidyl aminopeptidase/acylaminoacyl peptidase